MFTKRRFLLVFLEAGVTKDESVLIREFGTFTDDTDTEQLRTWLAEHECPMPIRLAQVWLIPRKRVEFVHLHKSP